MEQLGSINNSDYIIEESQAAKRTLNPIRAIVDNSNLVTLTNKVPISLSIGDPTLFDNLKTHSYVLETVFKNLQSYNYNGYCQAHGSLVNS